MNHLYSGLGAKFRTLGLRWGRKAWEKKVIFVGKLGLISITITLVALGIAIYDAFFDDDTIYEPTPSGIRDILADTLFDGALT